MNQFKKISFTLAKNEEDIIESFVRHNVQYIDHMYIADNMSSDSTKEILLSLKDEGLPITIWDDLEPAHLQSKKSTAAYHKIINEREFDLFVLLDADEFLLLKDDTQDYQFQLGDVLEVTRACYVISTLEPDPVDVIKNMSRRMRELQTSKAAILFDPSRVNGLKIGEGSHHVYYGGVLQNKKTSPFSIAHFPYRGLNNYLSKTILGWHAMLLKDSGVFMQEKPIGHHWKNNYTYIMSKGGVLSFEDLVKRLYQVSNLSDLDERTFVAPLEIKYKNKYSHLKKNYATLYLLARAHEDLISRYHLSNMHREEKPVIENFKDALFKKAERHFFGSTFFKKIWLYKERVIVLDFEINNNQIAFDCIVDDEQKTIECWAFSRNLPGSLTCFEQDYKKTKGRRILIFSARQEKSNLLFHYIENFLEAVSNYKKNTVTKKIIASIENFEKLIEHGSIIPLHWWDLKPNFGDEIGPYLVEKITQKPVVNIYGVTGVPGIMSVGSILHHLDKPGMEVWGSGLMHDNVEKIISAYKHLPPPRILAVRGKLTAEVLKQKLHWDIPDVFGDPGLLMPQFYKPKNNAEAKDKIVILPHHSHLKIFNALDFGEGTFLSNVGKGLLNVIDDIANAKCCISTSLHGLIVAQAYNVPWVWIRLADQKLAGDDFKFEDFFTTLAREEVADCMVTVENLKQLDIKKLASTASLPKSYCDLDKLLSVFVERWGKPVV